METIGKRRWPLLFGLAILLSLALRYPFLQDGHEDEVHTIGRALQLIYTGDLNPHFFYHPTGTMYLCIPANILAFASMSRDVGGRPGVKGDSPFNLVQRELPNPTQHEMFTGAGAPLWNLFRYRVRTIFVWLIPLQIVILWYIGKRLNLLPPALAAAFLLACSSANIRDSVYVSVNNTTGAFCLLAVALTAGFVCRTPAETMRTWLFRLAALSFVGGLAIACKYNAGTFLLIPMIYGMYTIPYRSTEKQFLPEKLLAGFAILLLGMTAGFTVLCPYWFKELQIFIPQVLYQVWYFKVGHADWNTFEPGWQMAYINLRCLADQFGWFGIVLTATSIGYLAWNGFFKNPEWQQTQWVLISTFAACAAFFVLMSNQAVFFARNFSIMWSSWFFCCAVSWWFAAKLFAEKRGCQNCARFQNLFLLCVTSICLLKAYFIDPALGPQREWWRQNDEIRTALGFWLRKFF
jgi:hypothetical protein